MANRPRLRIDQAPPGGKRKRWLLIGILLVGAFFLFHGRHDPDGPDAENATFPGSAEAEIGNSLLGERGPIYDRTGEELAVTLDRVSVYVNVKTANADEVADRLAPVIGVSRDVIYKQIRQGRIYVWLVRNISGEEEKAVAALNLKGVFLYREKIRYYPQNELTSQIVGYVEKGKGMGLSGAELSYNSLVNLRGDDFLSLGAVSLGKTDTVRKKALFLTTDLAIQKLLDEIVRDLSSRWENSTFAALFADMNTGSVLGDAQYPTYNPNAFDNEGIAQNVLTSPIVLPEKIRRLLRDVSLLRYQAEQKKAIYPWSISMLPGKIMDPKILGSQLRLWDRLGLNGISATDWARHGRLFAADEESLWRNTQEGASYGSVPVTASPLQIAQILDSLLTGKSQKLHVLDKIVDGEGNAFRFLTEGEENSSDSVLLSPDVKNEIVRLAGFRGEDGALSRAGFETVTLAYHDNEGGREYRRSYLCCTTVTTRNSQSLFMLFGRLPVFQVQPRKAAEIRDIDKVLSGKLMKLVMRQEIYPTISGRLPLPETRSSNYQDRKIIGSTVERRVEARRPKTHTMPPVTGMSLRKSLRELNNMGLSVRVQGSGVVVGQDPAAGVVVKEGDTCRLVLRPQ